jgi:hypothetical protein
MTETKVTITEQINVVVGARKKAQGMVDKKKSLYDDFIAKHTEFFGDVATSTTVVSEAEDKLRELTLKAYSETGNKAPEIGVGIRVVTILKYRKQEALTWAMEHKMALKLDTSGFEKTVKANPLTFPFVTITDEPTATIATELAKVE